MERASEALKLEMQLLCKPGSAYCAPLSGHANTYPSFKLPHDMQDGFLQLELHTIARLDKGGSTDSETLPHEVWSWTLGANSRHRPPSRQTHPAAERANAKVDRTAIVGRYGKLPGQVLELGSGTHSLPLLAAYTGLQVDIDRIRADNAERTDVERKSGLIIWSGRK